MDPIKVIIFVAIFLLLLLLGRKLSAVEEVHASPPELPQPRSEPIGYVAAEINKPKIPAAIGADLPFPLQLPELELREDGTYNRPEFLNYYFAEIDLITGPLNPASFCDEFFVEIRDPRDEHVGTYRYIVATPAGLQAEMESEHVSVVNLGDQSIIVSRWDLTLILDAVVKDIIKTYGGWANHTGEHALPQ